MRGSMCFLTFFVVRGAAGKGYLRVEKFTIRVRKLFLSSVICSQTRNGEGSTRSCFLKTKMEAQRTRRVSFRLLVVVFEIVIEMKTNLVGGAN